MVSASPVNQKDHWAPLFPKLTVNVTQQLWLVLFFFIFFYLLFISLKKKNHPSKMAAHSPKVRSHVSTLVSLHFMC